jgi:hypothetical protein
MWYLWTILLSSSLLSRVRIVLGDSPSCSPISLEELPPASC